MSLFIDIHILQTVPPSNVNRDDTGSPKTAVFGGVRRARVSSQAWKRATRTAFATLLDPTELGVRTKRVVDLVADSIESLDPTLTARKAELATAVLEAAGIKVTVPKAKPAKAKAAEEGSGDEGTADGVAKSGALLFLSHRQVEGLATLAVAHAGGAPLDKTLARGLADSKHSIDIALFGRFVADASDLTVDAAAQVAHALSVHAVDNEFDYFTALDDRAGDAETGADMIGTVEFNSSTLYRYATLDLRALHTNLGDGEATGRAVEAFVRAFITSMPTGKQNTFANRTLPDAAVVMVRDTQPVNLVGAFEEAVTAREGRPRLTAAAERIRDHSRAIDAAYGCAPVRTFVLRVGAATEPLAALGENVSLDTLIAELGVVARSGAAVPA